MNLEVEVKFFTTDLAQLREQLLTAGATLKKPRVFERNVRYDNAWDGLKRRDAILRLRQDAKVKITYKGVPEGVDLSQTQARVREELEIEVSDFETANLLIQRLGFEERQVYEKYRETLQFDDVEIVLDEMPYGDFVELEGTEASIKTVAGQVGLDWGQRIVTNYLGMFEQLRAVHQFEFRDLTFDNFVGLGISAGEVLSTEEG